MSHRAHPYSQPYSPPYSPPVIVAAPPQDIVATDLPIVHRFFYLCPGGQGWFFMVNLHVGAITWNGQTVPCEWELANGTLRLHFHHAGDMNRASTSVYTLRLDHENMRVWSSPQQGGQCLVQLH